jgi:hypothetical protein
MEAWPVTDLDKIAKGWEIAMKYSKERLQRVHDLAADELDDAINDGRLVLETVCLFVHACIRHNQYKYAVSLPATHMSIELTNWTQTSSFVLASPPC